MNNNGGFMQAMISASKPEHVLNYAKGNEDKTLGDLITNDSGSSDGSSDGDSSSGNGAGDYITDISNRANQVGANISNGLDSIKKTGQKIYNTGMRVRKALS